MEVTMADSDRVEISGSQRELVPNHPRIGDVDLTEHIAVTVYLRPRADTGWVDQEAQRAPAERSSVTREAWADRYGADPADIQAVQQFAAEHGLTVTDVNGARRAITLSGSVDEIASAFEAQLQGRFDAGAGAPGYRGRSGPLTVPSELGDAVTGVFGIDDRPQSAPQLRIVGATPAADAISYTPLQVAEAYAFPTDVDGSGATVGIIELGGGFQTSDLSTYFSGLGLSTPTVTAVPVDGGSNDPGQDTDADGEVMLDIEVIGAVANGVDIAVYFAPNTDQGFIDAITTAVHDTTNSPSVISISWGGPEDSWTAQARTQMDQAFTDAGGLGITVTVAAGDGGSTDGSTDGLQHVDFPASAPHALGCGGTTLHASGATISSETVWGGGAAANGATGGGVSVEFALPSYQADAKVPDNVDTGKPGRGVPDVAGNADPETGYQTLVDGSEQVVGGTSAVAPLWAGLVALLNQSLGAPLGFANTRLYELLGTAGFHDITVGNNGAYSAGPGWDACSGLGSPDGTQLASLLGGETSGG
jgi:kumamolisin